MFLGKEKWFPSLAEEGTFNTEQRLIDERFLESNQRYLSPEANSVLDPEQIYNLEGIYNYPSDIKWIGINTLGPKPRNIVLDRFKAHFFSPWTEEKMFSMINDGYLENSSIIRAQHVRDHKIGGLNIYNEPCIHPHLVDRSYMSVRKLGFLSINNGYALTFIGTSFDNDGSFMQSAIFFNDGDNHLHRVKTELKGEEFGVSNIKKIEDEELGYMFIEDTYNNILEVLDRAKGSDILVSTASLELSSENGFLKG